MCKEGDKMCRYGLVIDLSVCIGCHSCQFACSEKNMLPPSVWFRRVLHIEPGESGQYAGAFPAGCGHCEEPACVRVCQMGAMYKTQSGEVLHDERKCIGCGACTWACPYGAPSINVWTGKSQKCTGCIEERREGRLPSCVSACPTQCLRIEESDRIREEDELILDFLPGSDITRPSVRIFTEKRKPDGKS